MTQDTRRVQTAVLGRPDSDHPISLPTDRREAVLYLARYKNKRFFCGIHLGGCGWELMHKLYGDRVCHFAHHPDIRGLAPVCERRYFGADSADHLYIHRGLSSRLGGQAGAHRFQGTMLKGQCTDLLVNPGRGRSAVKVQFVNLPLDAWTQEDQALRARLGRVDWMLGPQAAGSAPFLLDRDGYALRVRCEQEGAARVVKVGTQTRAGDLEWSGLDACEIGEHGLVTPLLRKMRHTTPRPVRRAQKWPGFPLAVKEIVVLPQEKTTHPITRPGVPEGFHTASADIRIAGGERIHACIMVPGRLNLMLDEPYLLVEPASVDMMNAGAAAAAPTWTVFSAGLTPIGEVAPPTAPQASEQEPAPVHPPQSTEAPPKKKTKTVKVTAQSEALIRHELTSLIQDLRQTRRAGDDQLLLRTLAANEKTIKAATHRHFAKERDAIQELRRWAVAKDEARTRAEAEVRDRSAVLLLQIEAARSEQDLTEAQRLIEALRKTLARVSLRNPDFSSEAGSLRDHESWLGRARAEQERERAREQEARAESIRAQHRDRLGEVLDQLMRAEIAGKTDEVQTLYGEGRSLLKKLGSHATASDKLQLDLTAQWLAAVPANAGNKSGTSGAPSEGRTRPNPQEELADRIAAVLQRTARAQATISLEQLAKQVHADDVVCADTLLSADRTGAASGPMLSALVTSPEGKARSEFRQILAGFGYQVPQTELGLGYVWQREVERAHAFHAEPTRDMPPSLAPRKAEQDP